MGKSSGSTTQTSSMDPAMKGYIQQVWQAAQGAAGSPPPGMDPTSQAAIGGMQGYANAGQQGMAALGGDPAAMARLQNPYQQQVLGQMQNNYGRLAQQTMNATNDAATRAGAFGGSRAAIAQGTALGDLNRDQAGQMANLAYSGYQNAQNVAGNLANLGMGANQQLFGAGDYARQVQMQQDPANWRYGILNNTIRGLPYNQTQTGTQQAGHNPLAGAAGGALTGFAAGGPIGGLIGGIGGLFG